MLFLLDLRYLLVVLLIFGRRIVQDKLLLLIHLLQYEWCHGPLRTDDTFSLSREVVVQFLFRKFRLLDGIGLATTANILLCLFLVDEQALRPATRFNFLRRYSAKCNLAVTAQFLMGHTSTPWIVEHFDSIDLCQDSLI